LLVVGSQVAVFLYTLANAGEETGGLVAIIYTGVFTAVVVPAVELFFITWLGTTPGRALLGLRAPRDQDLRLRLPTGRDLSRSLLLPRFLARLIDAFMVGVLFAGVFIVMAIIVDDISAAWWKTLILSFLLLPGIEASSIHAYGATPGKRRLGLLVVDARAPNVPLTFPRCVARSLVVGFSFMIWWILPIFVFGWSFADPQGRGLHDLAAGSKVTRIPNGP
jgi:uncharacterized RDD family membrane protein YckC